MLLRDGNGGEEGGLGGGGVGGVSFEEDFAADAMRLRIEPALSAALCFCEDAIKSLERAVGVAGVRLHFGEQCFVKRNEQNEAARAKAVEVVAGFR